MSGFILINFKLMRFLDMHIVFSMSLFYFDNSSIM